MCIPKILASGMCNFQMVQPLSSCSILQDTITVDSQIVRARRKISCFSGQFTNYTAEHVVKYSKVISLRKLSIMEKLTIVSRNNLQFICFVMRKSQLELKKISWTTSRRMIFQLTQLISENTNVLIIIFESFFWLLKNEKYFFAGSVSWDF